MALTVDDLRRLNDSARSRVLDTQHQVMKRVLQPDVERRELNEYQNLTPEQHGQVYQTVGQEKYKQYIDAMERLKLKHGGQ